MYLTSKKGHHPKKSKKDTKKLSKIEEETVMASEKKRKLTLVQKVGFSKEELDYLDDFLGQYRNAVRGVTPHCVVCSDQVKCQKLAITLQLRVQEVLRKFEEEQE